LRARVGVHAGEPLPEDARLFGHCVNTAVRVCGVAEPGHVLVTDVVKQLTQGRFRFSGGASRTLKGFSAPVELYEFAWQHAQQRAGLAI
jgi:class 3 adenylate cyclase